MKKDSKREFQDPMPDQHPSLALLRTGLVKRMSDRQQLFSEEDARLVVRLVLEQIAKHLARGGRVVIRKFGTFDTRLRRARRARNPKTGATVFVPSRRVPRFTASRELLGRDAEHRPEDRMFEPR